MPNVAAAPDADSDNLPDLLTRIGQTVDVSIRDGKWTTTGTVVALDHVRGIATLRLECTRSNARFDAHNGECLDGNMPDTNVVY